MSHDIGNLIDSYASYISENLICEAVSNGYYEISTPFLNRHNDAIVIYVKMESQGNILISDNGETMEDLRLSGVEFNTEKKKRELNIILNGFGVIQKGTELYVRATAGDFSRKQHNLIQALLSVNDMYMLASEVTTGCFFEDVQEFFEKHDIRYSSNIILEGKTHLTHKFDFLINKSKNSKERLIKVVNSPNRENLKGTLFSFVDLGARGESSQGMLILNDTNKKIPEENIRAVSEYSITPIPWSAIDQYIPQLAA